MDDSEDIYLGHEEMRIRDFFPETGSELIDVKILMVGTKDGTRLTTSLNAKGMREAIVLLERYIKSLNDEPGTKVN